MNSFDPIKTIKKMKHNVIAALLLAAVTMMTVGCNKEDNIAPIEPEAKVSRIYVTNTTIMEQYNDSTQTWDTMYYFPWRALPEQRTLLDRRPYRQYAQWG